MKDMSQTIAERIWKIIKIAIWVATFLFCWCLLGIARNDMWPPIFEMIPFVLWVGLLYQFILKKQNLDAVFNSSQYLRLLEW
jgi:hypothetical protein